MTDLTLGCGLSQPCFWDQKLEFLDRINLLAAAQEATDKALNAASVMELDRCYVQPKLSYRKIGLRCS